MTKQVLNRIELDKFQQYMQAFFHLEFNIEYPFDVISKEEV